MERFWFVRSLTSGQWLHWLAGGQAVCGQATGVWAGGQRRSGVAGT